MPQDLWDGVQAKLSGKRPGPKPQARVGSGYLLAGLLFDDRGNRMTPSHVKKKNGQRYRYCVSQALSQRRKDEAGSLGRIQARAIEGLVICRNLRLQSASGDTSAARSELPRFVARVESGDRKVAIALHKSALGIGIEDIRRRLGENHHVAEEQDAYLITLPIRIGNWGGETLLEGPNREAAIDAVHLDKHLVDALIKAMTWRDQLASGQVRRIEQIARREGCDESRVRHLLPLAFLAPDIIERILLGKQPCQVTLDRLVRMEVPAK